MGAKSIKRNYIYHVIYNILMIITPLVTAPYLSRVLEADGIGTASFVASIVNYFLLFADMGSGGCGQREISYVRDDPYKLSQVFWEFQTLRLINVIICTVLYLLLTGIFAKENHVIYLIFSLNIINSVLAIGWFLGGLEEFGQIIFRNIIIRIIDITFVFLFVKTKSDLPLYLFGTTCFSILGNIVTWTYLRPYVKRPDFKALRPYRHLKTSFSFFVPSIAIQVYTVLDKSMLGFFTEGGFENGYYEQSMKISKLVLALITSLSSVMVPRIAYLFGKNDRKQINDYMYESYRFTWFLGIPLCFGLIGVSDNFVPWFFGPGYDKVSGLLKISSILIIAIGFGSTTGGQYLVPTRRQHLLTLSVVIGAISNFCMNIILIRLFQSYGAMYASVIAEITVSSVQLYVIRKELSIMKIIASSQNYLIAGTIMLSAVLFLNSKLTPSIIHTFVMVLTGAVIYFAVLLIMRDRFFINYSMKPIDYLKRKFRR